MSEKTRGAFQGFFLDVSWPAAAAAAPPSAGTDATQDSMPGFTAKSGNFALGFDENEDCTRKRVCHN